MIADLDMWQEMAADHARELDREDAELAADLARRVETERVSDVLYVVRLITGASLVVRSIAIQNTRPGCWAYGVVAVREFWSLGAAITSAQAAVAR